MGLTKHEIIPGPSGVITPALAQREATKAGCKAWHLNRIAFNLLHLHRIPRHPRCIDWQKIRVQELLGSDVQQQGRVPRTVEVRRPCMHLNAGPVLCFGL